MQVSATHLDVIRAYLKSIETGNLAEVQRILAPDAVMEQLPNRIYPNGIRADVTRMAEAFEKGRKLLSSQTYEIVSSVVDGNSVAVEVLWTGTLAFGFGNLEAGAQMRAHSAMFFVFKDGRITSQRNYDCFEPW